MEVELIEDAGRRRQWTEEEKHAILREAFAPGAVVKAVARRHGVNTGLLYGWRRKFWKGRPALGFSQVIALAEPVGAQSPPAVAAIEVETGLAGRGRELPYVPRNRHHRVSAQWRQSRKRAGHRRA